MCGLHKVYCVAGLMYNYNPVLLARESYLYVATKFLFFLYLSAALLLLHDT